MTRFPTPPSPANLAPSADWIGFADRLLAHLAQGPAAQWAFLEIGAICDQNAPDDIDAIDALLDTLEAPAASDGATPGAAPPMAVLRPRATVAQTVLRLARTFGDEAALQDVLIGPGSILLIEVQTAGLVEAVKNTLEAVLDAAAVQPAGHARARVMRTAGRDFSSDSFAELLESDRPIVLITANAAALPDDVAALRGA